MIRLFNRPGVWPIFEVLVQVSVILAQLFLPDPSGPLVRRAEVRLPDGFRTHRT